MAYSMKSSEVRGGLYTTAEKMDQCWYAIAVPVKVDVQKDLADVECLDSDSEIDALSQW